MRLNKSEFLITFILENFSKESNVMILFYVCFDPIDNGSSPFNDYVFQAVLLIQVCEHILLHSLPRLLQRLTFLIKLYLLRIHILNCFLELFQWEHSIRGYTKRDMVLLFWMNDFSWWFNNYLLLFNEQILFWSWLMRRLFNLRRIVIFL